jgi:pimeloyl-ACP methyl ester carboxylesterase/predicted glycosyltransferase
VSATEQTGTLARPADPEIGRGAEQSRARYPDFAGFVERDGQALFYEVYGEGDETLFLTPTWSLVHSRHWKMQIAYLSRHFRVVVMDGLGNGRSDRCKDPRRYTPEAFARDCVAVMDASDTPRALMVGLSRGAQFMLELARIAPERVVGSAFIGPLFPYTPSQWSLLLGSSWLTRRFYRHAPFRWWGHLKLGEWPNRYPEFVEWWFDRCFSEPHSSKGIEDAVGWALETDPQTMIATAAGGVHTGRENLRELAQNLGAPVLVLHGEHDRIAPPRDGRALSRLAGGRLEVIRGAGHLPHGRKPVQVNLALREFSHNAFGRKPRDPTVHRVDGRPRALFVSSPIGLGHAMRDVAIARELRRLHPDLQVDWLAQDPVTRVLEAAGETIHPASAHLANESRHIESESAEHDLHCFQALRRMDEILAANFMLFHDVVNDRRYDLWIGDEAWEIDYYLHENPGEKRAPFAWLTDFVGFLPMEDGGERERHLTADYNAQMVEHIAAHPRLRDVALFVGNPDDIVDERLGPDLPMIREWTERNFEFTGYVTGFDPAELADRAKLRDELGFGDDERVCIVTVGGTGVGEDLLRRVIASFPEAKERIPELRMIVVAGPRIDPASLPSAPGLEVVPFVRDLYRHLAASDVAIVQGGLTTAMELTAQKRPFLYFPLRHHFEQNFHVRHRLERYGAGRQMDYDQASPAVIASAIAQEIDRDVTYRDVELNGAALAAQRLAKLL